jgi:F-type H+-transporting ATPase subunit alpha
LETFAKFGTRLDESTRKIIDHGQRIRACLKQPESQPVSMIEQITVLLALTANLFDPLPLEKVEDAELALRKATADIPADVAGRLTSADKLSDGDRKAILEIATRALVPFQPTPKLKPDAEPKSDAGPKSASKSKSASEPKSTSAPRPAAKASP